MYIQLNHHRFLLMAGPLWYNQRTGEVLKASRRYNNQGKTGGDLAASLQLNVLMRAEEPGKLIYELVGGGQNARGFTALENPLWFQHGLPHYVADHPVLRFLWHKIAHFLHDFHGKWFSKLGLPPPNGKHDQLFPFQIKGLQRRLVSSPNDRYAQKRPEINVYSRLEIGHKHYAGCQLVYCKPFKKFHNPLRMDYVFFIPPPPFYTGRRGDFEVDLDSCSSDRVVLLFRMKVKADSGEIWECDCAMIDVLFDLKSNR